MSNGRARLPPSQDGFTLEEMPLGWAACELREVGVWSSGGTPARTRPEYFGPGVPWIKSGDLPDGPIVATEEQITELGLQNSAAKLLPKGTVSMALYGATIGKLGIFTCTAATNQACANVIPNQELTDSRFLFYYLLAERQSFIDLAQGGAQPNISQQIVRDYPFKAPPLAEQQRIVAALDAVLAKVASCRERLARIPTLLKRFRQAVLAAACSGRLTADWREQHHHECEAPAEPSDDLPPKWTWSTVGAAIQSLKYGTSKRCDYQAAGVPVLRIPNVANGVISHDDIKFAELPQAEFEQLRLSTGDLLMIRSNGSVSLVGKTAVIRKREKDFAYAGYLMRLRPNETLIDPQYMHSTLATYDVRLQIELTARSTSGVNNINSEEVRALTIPLPPLPEQQEIVRRVDALFAVADRIEARYEQARRHVDRLAQSVLAKAFRGELVPTEHALAAAEGRDYESAAQLLERIRAAEPAPAPAPSRKRAARRSR